MGSQSYHDPDLGIIYATGVQQIQERRKHTIKRSRTSIVIYRDGYRWIFSCPSLALQPGKEKLAVFTLQLCFQFFP
jgi:hypothetical protein